MATKSTLIDRHDARRLVGHFEEFSRRVPLERLQYAIARHKLFRRNVGERTVDRGLGSFGLYDRVRQPLTIHPLFEKSANVEHVPMNSHARGGGRIARLLYLIEGGPLGPSGRVGT